eukprot:GILJ01001039.1.p1 GENE.GILJ01001039.1~~GILJ01001039.1.p1  ORF type:complete len:211 (-),score=21.24 GILJ01001039.1:80-712(-)
MDKQVYVIRHGQSEYNAWKKRAIMRLQFCVSASEVLRDAELTEKGRKQCGALGSRIKQSDLSSTVELIISSPLTRAIQTALTAFEGARIPIIINPLIRERMHTFCDVGSPPSVLADKFPSIDVSHLKQHWWCVHNTTHSVPCRETLQSVDERIEQFLQWLHDRPEKVIVIVGHSKYFQRWLGGRKLRNCELRPVDMGKRKRKSKSTIKHL